jgi:ferritin-like metal-binding protein YciE
MKTLHDLFVNELSDIYDAEIRLHKALPKICDAVSDEQLIKDLQTHLKETENQIGRLDKVCDLMDLTLEDEDCEAMKGLLEECEDLIGDIDDKEVLDTALIIATQKIEHYEIASYGSLCALAETLGLRQVADLLSETLAEEKRADEKLTKLAKTRVNTDAARRAA